MEKKSIMTNFFFFKFSIEIGVSIKKHGVFVIDEITKRVKKQDTINSGG